MFFYFFVWINLGGVKRKVMMSGEWRREGSVNVGIFIEDGKGLGWYWIIEIVEVVRC